MSAAEKSTPVHSFNPASGNSVSGADRRTDPRFGVEIGAVVGFSHNDRNFEGVIVDISLGGMRFRMTAPPPVIEDDFTVMHPQAGALQVRQSWIKGSAMGVEFAMPHDSRLARSLRCVQLLLDEEAESGGPESAQA